MNHKRTAFTLTELLAVIGVVAVAAAIIFPVFAQARGKARQASCASNLRQLGVALLAYSQDYDEAKPIALTSPGLLNHRYPVNMGWAGRVFPYAKNVHVFRCPGDAGTDAAHAATGKTAFVVSYALNLNLALSSHLASLFAPSRTVLAFEVVGNRAQITDVAEGTSAGAPLPRQLSAVGNGTSGSIFDLTQVPPPMAPNGGRLTLYATGLMDNYRDTSGAGDADYQDQRGRHSNGANFLAADGHVRWLSGKQVSAGISAPSPNSPQSRSGCAYWGKPSGFFPCAEGTAVGKHVMTFSAR